MSESRVESGVARAAGAGPTVAREEKAEAEAVVVVESAAPGEVVVLFVAHNGVNHPDLWRRWLQGSAVRAFVYCNPDVALPAGEWEGRRLKAHRETRWGHRSIVYATQAALAEVLVRAPRLGVVYIVSGADIPIQSAETLCRRPHGTCMRHARFRFATEAGLDALFESRHGVAALSSMFFIHDQWMSLGRTDAARFAGASLAPMDTVDDWFARHPPRSDPVTARLWRQGLPDEGRVRGGAEALRQMRAHPAPDYEGPAPDNYYVIMTLLLASHNNNNNNNSNNTTTKKSDAPAEWAATVGAKPVTFGLQPLVEYRDEKLADVKHRYYSASPWLYGDLDAKLYDVTSDPAYLMSLRELVAHTREHRPEVMFLRKVAREAFASDPAYAPWDPPHPASP